MIPHLLTYLLFLPLIGAVAVLLSRRNVDAARWIGLATSIAVFALSLPLYFGYDAANPAMQFAERMLTAPGFTDAFGGRRGSPPGQKRYASATFHWETPVFAASL